MTVIETTHSTAPDEKEQELLYTATLKEFEDALRYSAQAAETVKELEQKLQDARIESASADDAAIVAGEDLIVATTTMIEKFMQKPL